MVQKQLTSSSKTTQFDMSAMEDEEGSTTNYDGDDDSDSVSLSSIGPTIKRSKIAIALVLLIGIAGGICFVVLSLKAEQKTQNTHFEARATQLAKDISNTVQEYEVAVRSVHNVCRKRETTRLEFRQFYEYLTSGGLQFGAAQCLFNVSHEERPIYEAEAKAFYDEYYPTTVNYTGFKGFKAIVDEETGTTGVKLIPVAEDAPFYFPVHYSEPVISNAAALGLDVYSHPFQKSEVDTAIQNHQPVLGGRLKVVQETAANSYSVIIRHPGIPVSEEEDEFVASQHSGTDHIPKELGGILVRIPSLLERRADEQKESIACYLFDISPSRTDGGPVYLGAAQYEAKIANGTVVTDVRFPDTEVDFQDVVSNYDENRLLEVDIPIADGMWKLMVTPLPTDDSFEVRKGDIIFGGAMIFFCAIFLAVFLWRNMRQMKAIHQAKQQAEAERKIIASLYPENVIQRLLADEQAKQRALKMKRQLKGKVFDGKMDGTAATTNVNVASPLEAFDPITRMMMTQQDPIDTKSISLYGSNPIADHFENTSILFMDMVGFTAWSNSREPTQVFTFLEHVYHSFDMIAKRRRVFKVETVGDCYVAVVGLPNPRKNHAAVMCKFATECLIKMKALLHELAPTLGADTINLNLRVGIHSGPVTGGVLRGEKGRFQLFGDSMNFAARMEHHGKPGKIHVSPATAQSLMDSDKGKWLTVREDKITAKGLGEMTTYWVTVNTESIGTGRSGLTGTVSLGDTSHSRNPSNHDVIHDIMPTSPKGKSGSRLRNSLVVESFMEDELMGDESFANEAPKQAPSQAPGSWPLLKSFADKWGITDEIEI